MAPDKHSTENRFCLSRRKFLLAGGTTVLLSTLPGFARPLSLKLRGYPRKKVATMAQLKQDTPISFNYPSDNFLSSNLLVKLGAPAGGGVGPDEDIVAFNHYCTHMGGPLVGAYKKEYKAIGPCPLHLTTFDLTRHGIVIAGHATESLPQIVLEMDGPDIYATGVMGLIYGHNANLGIG